MMTMGQKDSSWRRRERLARRLFKVSVCFFCIYAVSVLVTKIIGIAEDSHILVIYLLGIVLILEGVLYAIAHYGASEAVQGPGDAAKGKAKNKDKVKSKDKVKNKANGEQRGKAGKTKKGKSKDKTKGAAKDVAQEPICGRTYFRRMLVIMKIGTAISSLVCMLALVGYGFFFWSFSSPGVVGLYIVFIYGSLFMLCLLVPGAYFLLKIINALRKKY
jgi:uncharacterized integral membrane protein